MAPSRKDHKLTDGYNEREGGREGGKEKERNGEERILLGENTSQ